MNKQLLELLEKNARYTTADLATMLGISADEVRAEIAKMQKDGLIRGFKTIIDWERLDSAYVSALIELNITPLPDLGFEDTAKKIMQYDEVESVYLMSGSYDLAVIVKGKTFQEVAMFVGKVLAPMSGVISTATHFVLRRYKEMDVIMCGEKDDDRGSFWL